MSDKVLRRNWETGRERIWRICFGNVSGSISEYKNLIIFISLAVAIKLKILKSFFNFDIKSVDFFSATAKCLLLSGSTCCS